MEILSYSAALGFREKLELVRQIALQLACIHSAGYLHLNLLPENVGVLPSEGRVALRCPSAEEENKAAEKRAFTAPEKSYGRVENRTDIYSLGALMHLLLFGDVPDGEAVAAGLPELSEECSAALKEVLGKCLARRPSGRYSCCEELAEGLEGLMLMCSA